MVALGTARCCPHAGGEATWAHFVRRSLPAEVVGEEQVFECVWLSVPEVMQAIERTPEPITLRVRRGGPEPWSLERDGSGLSVEEMVEGDLLVISELSRLSRSFLGMVNEVSNLLERGIQIKTLDKRLDTTAMPKEITMLIVSVLGYAASQELDQIKTRTAEGRAVARNRGVKFGRKRTYTEHQEAEVLKKRSAGEGYGTIARSLGMSRSMVQRIVKEQEAVTC